MCKKVIYILLALLLVPALACSRADPIIAEARKIIADIPLPDPGIDPQYGDKFGFSPIMIYRAPDSDKNPKPLLIIYVIAANLKYKTTYQAARKEYRLVISDFWGAGTAGTVYTLDDLRQYHDKLYWKYQSDYR
jgi:hypothetical protein